MVPIAALNDEQLESMQNEIRRERQSRLIEGRPLRATDTIGPSPSRDDGAMRMAEMTKTAGDSNYAPPAAPLSLDNVVDAFQYHPWDREQREAGTQVVDALIAAAKTILRVVPAGADRTVALRKLREARMDANSAITHRGRF